MFRKTVTRAMPEGARLIAPGRVRFQDPSGKWLERTVNSKGRILDKSKKFYGWVKGADGRRKAVPLSIDRAASLQILARKAKLGERQAEGLSATETNDPHQSLAVLSEAWFSQLADEGFPLAQMRNIRPRLAKMLGQCRLVKVMDFFTPDFTETVKVVMKKLGVPGRLALPKGCEPITFTEMRTILCISQPALWCLCSTLGIEGTGKGAAKTFTREQAERIIAHKNRPISAKTINDHLLALRVFVRWLKTRGTISQLPDFPKVLDVKLDRRLVRRAISSDELEHLAQAAEDKGLTRSRIDPQSRAILYRLAFWSLARSRALRELKVSDLHLAGKQPFFSLRGETDKNGMARAIPIKPDHAKALAKLVRGRKPDDLVFPFDYRTMAMTVRSDLRLAGIPYRTADGIFDFHAFRHAGTSHYFASGVDATVIAKLGGWSNTTQLLQTYGHLSPRNIADLIRGAW